MKVVGHVSIVLVAGRVVKSLEKSTVPLLLPHTAGQTRWRGFIGTLLVALIVCNNGVNGVVEDVVDSRHLLAAAFHIASSHLLSDSHPLFFGDGCQSLCFEEINTGSFCSKIRLESHEDEGCVGAEM